jgi:hypothetical protein
MGAPTEYEWLWYPERDLTPLPIGETVGHMSDKESTFGTRQRIRPGIWGLGRGMAFYKMLKARMIR